MFSFISLIDSHVMFYNEKIVPTFHEAKVCNMMKITAPVKEKNDG